MMQIGVGLWNLRATAAHPAAHPELYEQLRADARAAEQAGFDSIWLGEHRFWYDGWCPMPVVAAAAAASATRRIGVGTAMHLMPQHDLATAAGVAADLHRLFPDRLHLGVAVGYRDEEYRGGGLTLADRAPRMEAALDELAQRGVAERVWVGGMSAAALRRAGRRGTNILLPPTVTLEQTRALIGVAREAAAAHGLDIPHVGLMRDVWVGPADWFRDRLRAHYTEYVAAWWGRGDRSRVPAQVERNLRTAVAGTAAEAHAALAPFAATGVDTLVLQTHTEYTHERCATQLARMGEELLPLLRASTETTSRSQE